MSTPKTNRIISPFAHFIPLNKLVNISKQKLILPFYHSINNTPPPHLKHLYPVLDTNRFEQDLDFFLQNFNIISFETLKNHLLNHNPLKEKSFFLSFDDGLRECIDFIAPILRKKGIPAAFFLNSAFVDNKKLFYRYKVSLLINKIRQKNAESPKIKKIKSLVNNKSLENLPAVFLHFSHKDISLIQEIAEIMEVDFKEYLQKQQPYMTGNQIKKLLQQGFTIGAHSHSHPNYQLLSVKQQIEETKKSINFIQQHFNLNYRIFAFPFSDEKVKHIFFDTIYNNKNILDMSFGTAGIKKNEKFPHFQRIPMETKNRTAKTIIKTEYLAYLFKIPFGKHKIVRG